MSWSLFLGRVAGIKLQIHWTFALLLAWVGFGYLARGEGPAAAVVGIGFLLALFACVLLHELGHALAARSFGIPTKDITLLPIGGVARLERMPTNPYQELIVAIAGPAVNVVIASAIAITLIILGGITRLEKLPSFESAFLLNLMWVNIVLVIFNLLPAFPMDGGRVLRAFLAMQMDYSRATDLAASIGQMMAILFAFIGIFHNPWLLLIALFVYVSANSEAEMVRTREALRGVTVRDAMMNRYTTLEHDQSLSDAADRLLEGAQQDFPIRRDSNIVGLLRRSDLFAGLSAGSRDDLVAKHMLPLDWMPQANADVQEVLERMRGLEVQSMPVLEHDELIGIISLENVGEYMMLRGNLNGTPPPNPTTLPTQ